MSDSRLAPVWSALRAAGRTALIPYLTAGYPDRDASEAALRAADGVADILEVGVPFSDPLADGPTIQRSTFEALQRGMTLAGTLELVRRAELRTPVVVFSYLNPILRYGVDRFVRDADALGVAGVILTDLPAGGDPGVERALQASPLDLIRLVAPTTRDDRLAEAVTDAEGFIYLVARLGVTGASRALADDLADSVARVRRATTLPVAVGLRDLHRRRRPRSSPGWPTAWWWAARWWTRSGTTASPGRAASSQSLRAGLDAPAGVA